MSNHNHNDGCSLPKSESAVIGQKSDKCEKDKVRDSLAVCNLMSHIRLWPITIIGLLADLLSKSWALERLGHPGVDIPQPLDIIDGYVRFITVFNRGAVGGVAAGKTTFLLVVSVVAVIFLLWLFVTSRSDQRLWHISIGMLLAGALGNIHDRLFNNGQVVDFIEVNLHFWPANPWPTFNIADVLLCVGVAILIIKLLFKSEKTNRT